MVRLAERLGSALCKLIVPIAPASKTMVSASGLRLAAVIASRNEPGPLSSLLVTGIVAARAPWAARRIRATESAPIECLLNLLPWDKRKMPKDADFIFWTRTGEQA